MFDFHPTPWKVVNSDGLVSLEDANGQTVRGMCMHGVNQNENRELALEFICAAVNVCRNVPIEALQDDIVDKLIDRVRDAYMDAYATEHLGAEFEDPYYGMTEYHGEFLLKLNVDLEATKAEAKELFGDDDEEDYFDDDFESEDDDLYEKGLDILQDI